MDYGITTKDGSVQLLLSGSRVTMQVSEETLRRVDESFQRRTERRGRSLGDAIASSILKETARDIDARLRTPIEVDIGDIEEVRYENGRLQFVYREPRPRAFEKVQVGSAPAVAAFSDEDARAFVEKFRQVKAGLR